MKKEDMLNFILVSKNTLMLGLSAVVVGLMISAVLIGFGVF